MSNETTCSGCSSKESKIQDLLMLILELALTSCSTQDGFINSMGNSTYAEAMGILSENGIIEIVEQKTKSHIIAKLKR